MRRLSAPLAPLALAALLGIALAPWIDHAVAWTLVLAALVWGTSLTALERPGSAAACLVLGVAAAGALRAPALPPAADHVARLDLPRAARVEGRLAAEPARLAPERTRLRLDVERVDGETRSGRIQLTLYGLAPRLTEGQRLRAETRLHRAAGFRNPGGFDYGDYLEREGILVVGSARAASLTPLDDPRSPWNVRLKRGAREAIGRSLPPAAAALLAGLLLGDRSELPREIDDGFRQAGVYHVLAVSGFNIALIAGAVFALLSLARCGRRAAAVGAMAAVSGFALIVGLEPSVLRAVIMGLLVLGALLLEREASVLNGLAVAALLILILRPADLFDPGFQLSFAATAAIVLVPLPRGIVAGALGVSVAAQLAVLPIALVHFNQLSTIAPLANLAVVPLAGVATIVGLVGVAVAVVTPVAGEILLNATWPILLGLRAVVAAAALVPWATLRLPAPPGAGVAAYVLALGLGLVWWRLRETRPQRARWTAGGALVLLALAVAIATWPLVRPPDGRLRVTVLDVGQGDAIGVELPDGRAAVIDAGPGGGMRLDAGERVVAPFLWNRGVLSLAATVATHDDQDHAGGMVALHRRFTVGGTLSREGRQWLGGISVVPLTAPAGVTASLRPAAVGRSRNDDALVLRLDYGLASFLLASDIGPATEAALVAIRAPLHATVLKVAHHGSGASSTAAFLERVRPQFAVVSVGARNGYGHPAPETLARLAAVGARVYRTDRDGAVIFETDGQTLAVTRWASRQTERYCLERDGKC